MLSCFLISFCFALWISVVVAQEKEAFPALNTTSDYTSLDPCQKACLDDDRAAGSYDTLDAAKQRCVDLGVQLHGVDTCLAGSLVPQCRTDDAAQVAAKSVLAAYCTSIGLQYAFNVMPTSVGGASTSANAAITTPTGLASSTTDVASSVDGPSATPVTGDGSPGVTSATSDTAPAITSSADPASSTLATTQRSKTGLTSSAKAGIGVGVGLGIPLIIGAIAAWWFLSRRKKTRAAGGPYASVMTSEKGRTESGSYSNPRMEPQEMQPIGYTAPFLPGVAMRDAAHHEDSYEPTPVSAVPKDLPYSDSPVSGTAYEGTRSSPLQEEHHQPAQTRPATSRDVSRGGTPPPPLDTQARPATAHARLAPPEDEPPSPISPVSPVSPAGSRPASLRDHHDL